jgi:hypothetical protein
MRRRRLTLIQQRKLGLLQRRSRRRHLRLPETKVRCPPVARFANPRDRMGSPTIEPVSLN